MSQNGKIHFKNFARFLGCVWPFWVFMHLSLSWRRSLSCRNQSIDLQSKSIDWFLYYLSLCEKLSNMSKIAFFGYSLALFTQVKPKMILPRIILPKADRESSTYTNLLFLFFSCDVYAFSILIPITKLFFSVLGSSI